MSTGIARRSFLLAVASIVSGSPAYASMRRVTCAGSAQALDRRVLATLIGDCDAAAAIGNAYLRDYPFEADRDALIETTVGTPDAPEAVLRQRITERRRGDLAACDVVIVGGWQLARTEARLCALVALSPV